LKLMFFEKSEKKGRGGEEKKDSNGA